jgi:RNA polymerase sigma-70 factor (ECF subfamily)
MSEAIVADTTFSFPLDPGHPGSGEHPDIYSTAAAFQGPAATDDDRELVSRLCAAEETAYEILIHRFERPVFSLVSRLLDDSEDAHDVVQEVFLKIFRNIGCFRGNSSLKTWVYRIAVNEARNQRRWFGRHKRQEIALEPEPGVAHGCVDTLTDPGRSPLELALDQEMHALIESALSELNPTFRAALVLREIECLSYEEIADILEVSLGTVKSRIVRGREALREQLAKRMTQEEQARHGLDTRAAETPVSKVQFGKACLKKQSLQGKELVAE